MTPSLGPSLKYKTKDLQWATHCYLLALVNISADCTFCIITLSTLASVWGVQDLTKKSRRKCCCRCVCVSDQKAGWPPKQDWQKASFLEKQIEYVFQAYHFLLNLKRCVQVKKFRVKVYQYFQAARLHPCWAHGRLDRQKTIISGERQAEIIYQLQEETLIHCGISCALIKRDEVLKL